MPAGSCSIPSFNPATGRISTRSLSRSRRSNKLRLLESRHSVSGLSSVDQRLNTRNFNAQRSTSNAQRSISRVRVGRWALDVGRWALLSFLGRVKGAWWPPRSSKPSSVGNGRDRFDSYPLRQFIFDFRSAICDWQTAGSEIEIRNSKFEISERG